jgi:effector-binding domain-containing protein
MLEATIKRTFPATVAFIEMHGAYSQAPEGYTRLYAWVAERGLAPAGPPSAVYYATPDETAESDQHWELQAPVLPPLAPVPPGDSGIGVKELASATVASAMHHGPYEACVPTYRALEQWIAEHGYVIDGPPSETYFSDPEEVPPEEYLTEIHFPVRSV